MILLWLFCFVVIVLLSAAFLLTKKAKPEVDSAPVVKKGSQSMSKKEKQPKQQKTPKEVQPKQRVQKPKEQQPKAEPLAPKPQAENVAVVNPAPVAPKKSKKAEFVLDNVAGAVPVKQENPASPQNQRPPKVQPKKKQPRKEISPEREGADSDLLAYGHNFAKRAPVVVEKSDDSRPAVNTEWREIRSKEELDLLKDKIMSLEADLFMARKTSEGYLKKANDMKLANARLQQLKLQQEETMRHRIERLEEEVQEIKSGKKSHIDDDLSVLNYTISAAAPVPAPKMHEIMKQEATQREHDRLALEVKQKEEAHAKKEAAKSKPKSEKNDRGAESPRSRKSAASKDPQERAKPKKEAPARAPVAADDSVERQLEIALKSLTASEQLNYFLEKHLADSLADVKELQQLKNAGENVALNEKLVRLQEQLEEKQRQIEDLRALGHQSALTPPVDDFEEEAQDL